MTPGGVRMGTPALTSRGLTEEDFVIVAEYFNEAVLLALEISKDVNNNGKEFKALLSDANTAYSKYPQLKSLQQKVQVFARGFPTVGFE